MDVIDVDGVDDQVQAETTDSATVEIEHPADGKITHMDTRNESLDGEHHPVTGVEFHSKIVTLPSGDQIEGVFQYLIVNIQ